MGKQSPAIKHLTVSAIPSNNQLDLLLLPKQYMQGTAVTTSTICLG